MIGWLELLAMAVFTVGEIIVFPAEYMFIDRIAPDHLRGWWQHRRDFLEHPDWQALRWDLEELRVSLFAQELGTKRQVSAKRLARQLEALAGRR